MVEQRRLDSTTPTSHQASSRSTPPIPACHHHFVATSIPHSAGDHASTGTPRFPCRPFEVLAKREQGERRVGQHNDDEQEGNEGNERARKTQATTRRHKDVTVDPKAGKEKGRETHENTSNIRDMFRTIVTFSLHTFPNQSLTLPLISLITHTLYTTTIIVVCRDCVSLNE
jgi:hypothetical protein